MRKYPYPKMSEERKQELVKQIKPLVDAGYTPDEIIDELDLIPRTVHTIFRTIKGYTLDQYHEYLLSIRHKEKRG